MCLEIAARFSIDRPVVVLDRGIAMLPAGQSGIDVDIEDAAALEQALDMTVAQHGPIAVLVNTTTGEATISGRAADFCRIFGARLEAAQVAARGAARHMQVAGGGAIVNVLPTMISTRPPRRASLRMLTRRLACEWAALGIRVNAVAPGHFCASDRPLPNASLARDCLGRDTPMARSDELWEIAGIIAFLASDAASYVTGSNWAVDGGSASKPTLRAKTTDRKQGCVTARRRRGCGPLLRWSSPAHRPLHPDRGACRSLRAVRKRLSNPLHLRHLRWPVSERKLVAGLSPWSNTVVVVSSPVRPWLSAPGRSCRCCPVPSAARWRCRRHGSPAPCRTCSMW
ncbi:SDR family NAD(P)-dependent oxidoreductase [Xanthomonas cerealis]|uniref:SDR family NAD(P)-dependent oxidoreductase n=1 Tax=Xanthomonas cerealis TaxID=3390025 RepID=UPI0009B7F142|nr:SDR family oxidoreductase [Xanthomonas translucens]